jgi:hypothetical protein
LSDAGEELPRILRGASKESEGELPKESGGCGGHKVCLDTIQSSLIIVFLLYFYTDVMKQ